MEQGCPGEDRIREAALPAEPGLIVVCVGGESRVSEKTPAEGYIAKICLASEKYVTEGGNVY
jgi:hypothetical protein